MLLNFGVEETVGFRTELGLPETIGIVLLQSELGSAAPSSEV